MVVALAPAAVEEALLRVWVRRAGLDRSRSGLEGRVVVAAHIEPRTRRTHVVGRDHSRLIQLVLEAEVPLLRVRILEVRVHVPEHPGEGSRGREQALREGVRDVDCRKRRFPGGLVEVVAQLLRDIRPAAFEVLGRLRHRRPFVEENPVRRAEDGAIGDAIGDTDPRLEVLRGVVVDLAAGVNRHVLRKRSVRTWYAGSESALRA